MGQAGDASRAKNHPALAECPAWVLGAQGQNESPWASPHPHPRALSKMPDQCKGDCLPFPRAPGL